MGWVRPSSYTCHAHQALQLMRAGDRWELYIPSELAYGSRGAGGKIGADEVLIFDLELLSLNTGGVGPVEKAAPPRHLLHTS